jgi:pimeloyl-ACP methyl ester carboxylesterase
MPGRERRAVVPAAAAADAQLLVEPAWVQERNALVGGRAAALLAAQHGDRELRIVLDDPARLWAELAMCTGARSSGVAILMPGSVAASLTDDMTGQGQGRLFPARGSRRGQSNGNGHRTVQRMSNEAEFKSAKHAA